MFSSFSIRSRTGPDLATEGCCSPSNASPFEQLDCIRNSCNLEGTPPTCACPHLAFPGPCRTQNSATSSFDIPASVSAHTDRTHPSIWRRASARWRVVEGGFSKNFPQVWLTLNQPAWTNSTKEATVKIQQKKHTANTARRSFCHCFLCC